MVILSLGVLFHRPNLIPMISGIVLCWLLLVTLQSREEAVLPIDVNSRVYRLAKAKCSAIVYQLMIDNIDEVVGRRKAIKEIEGDKPHVASIYNNSLLGHDNRYKLVKVL
jgi:hypothetical protein